MKKIVYASAAILVIASGAGGLYALTSATAKTSEVQAPIASLEEAPSIAEEVPNITPATTSSLDEAPKISERVIASPVGSDCGAAEKPYDFITRNVDGVDQIILCEEGATEHVVAAFDPDADEPSTSVLFPQGDFVPDALSDFEVKVVRGDLDGDNHHEFLVQLKSGGNACEDASIAVAVKVNTPNDLKVTEALGGCGPAAFEKGSFTIPGRENDASIGWGENNFIIER